MGKNSRLVAGTLLGGMIGAVIGYVCFLVWAIAQYGLMRPKDPALLDRMRFVELLVPLGGLAMGSLIGVGIASLENTWIRQKESPASANSI